MRILTLALFLLGSIQTLACTTISDGRLPSEITDPTNHNLSQFLISRPEVLQAIREKATNGWYFDGFANIGKYEAGESSSFTASMIFELEVEVGNKGHNKVRSEINVSNFLSTDIMVKIDHNVCGSGGSGY